MEVFMNRQWVLVAHRGGAKVFERQIQKGLALLQRFQNPEARHSRTQEENGSAEEKANHLPRFAKSICRFLDKERSLGRYDRLVIIAEPKLLGMLRSALSPRTLNAINVTVDRDFAQLPDSMLYERLRSSFVI